jgi:protein tyrosine/serine phosphatase
MSNQRTPNHFRFLLTIALIFVSLQFSGCATVATPAPEPRPDIWALKVADKPGLDNLYRVNSNLYRSAQPTAEGFLLLNSKQQLFTDLPIKTVISLRALHDDAPLLPKDPTFKLEQIHFNTWHPENEDVIKFLRFATTKENQPILVHCQHGSDRTGTMVAIYRIAYEGWTKDQAIDEMIRGGYGFHIMWQNLRYYIEQLDINAIKAQVAKLENKNN